MARLGVPAPLRSFAWVTVNGEPHGLFLAVEEPEEAFALRNFGPRPTGGSTSRTTARSTTKTPTWR